MDKPKVNITFKRPRLAGYVMPPVRPGSTDLLQAPSRMSNNLHYPDGRIVKDARNE